MSIFDDGFDTEDAAIIAGVMGFAEESLREENTLLEDLENAEDDSDVKEVVGSHDVLQRLYNENPGLVEYLLKIVAHQKEELLERKQRIKDAMEVAHEIEAMNATLGG